MGMPDMQSVEQTMNMSPMDLFDSIFWGEYDFTTNESEINLKIEHYPVPGLEQIGFDYNEQLYPPF